MLSGRPRLVYGRGMDLVQLPRPTRDAPPRLADYPAERESFVLDIPARLNAVVSIVDGWATEDPDALATLSLGPTGELERMTTAAELCLASRRAARALLELGIGKGDRVLIMLPPIPEWHAAMLGCMRIGAVPVPSPNLLTPMDIAYRLEKAEIAAAIADGPAAAKVDRAGGDLRVKLGVSDPPAGWLDFGGECEKAGDGEISTDPTSRDDPLLIYFTSGTVSSPKLVGHAHSYAFGHVGTARFWHDLRPGDLHWTVADPGWAKAAWGALFGQWHERACVVQAALAKPDPELILATIARHGITSFCAPPTLYRSLVHADFSAHDLSALRHCTSAGEPLNPEVIRAWREGTGLTIYDGYGQTETTCLVANYRALEVRPGSMGLPVPGWDVTVVDEDGQPVEANTVGNVVVRTENEPIGLFTGYQGDPGATARAFGDGLYYTGDKAAIDDDGYFWFEGRNDDVITSSAYRIGPFEVESALIAHAAVVEAAAVGRDDPERTQIVVGVCVLAAGFDPSEELARELQDHVKATTAPYKYPREIHFVDALPKTVSGKIRRTEVREWLSDGTLPKP
jgi:acyl-coenzyme A synthetase/AMP-(fatty) acid ligase